MSLDIHAVMFRPDGMVEITYQEARDTSEYVNVIRTVLVDRSVLQSVTSDVQEAAEDLVDEAILLMRNPKNVEPLRRTSDD